MRVLRATSKTQGDQPTDFCWTTEGEILCLPFVRCDNNETATGKHCGCQESLVGVETRKSTTTFLVDELLANEEELRGVLRNSYLAAGFGDAEDVVEDSIATHRMAEVLPLGSVCDFVDHILNVRV